MLTIGKHSAAEPARPVPKRDQGATRRCGLSVPAWALASLLAAFGAWAAGVDQVRETPIQELGVNLQPPLPPTSTFPAQLVLDDNGVEAAVGVFGVSARQFLWFNRFTAGDVEIQEIWVFFPQGQGVAPGDDIQLVVYQDLDGDPTNGADLLFSLDTTVQVADGLNFSIYPIPPTLVSGDALVGVIPRYIDSGVTPPTSPAALDTSASLGRSYLALWLGDPPVAPSLPTDDDIVLIDDLVAGGGNWAIRAFGVAGPSDIPVTTPAGLVLLSLLLAAAAALLLNQRRLLPGPQDGSPGRR